MPPHFPPHRAGGGRQRQRSDEQRSKRTPDGASIHIIVPAISSREGPHRACEQPEPRVAKGQNGSARGTATMCGILAALLGNPDTHVNQLIVDGLTVLQHRGQGERLALAREGQQGMEGPELCCICTRPHPYPHTHCAYQPLHRRGRHRDVREGPPEPAERQRAGGRGVPAAPHDQAPGTCVRAPVIASYACVRAQATPSY